MKKFMNEFKTFIARGNVMSMAVGIIIGGAFTAIVTSLVEDIINPLLGLFGGANLDKYQLQLTGEVTLNYGKFISSVLNFIIMAFIVFLLVRAVNRFTEKLTPKAPEEPAVPTTKVCPYCKTEIAVEATRCPHCTSILEEKAAIEQTKTVSQA